MESVANLIELKPDSAADIEAWRSHIEAHRDEALQTLRNEGVAVESWFLFHLEGKDFLLAYMRADSIARAGRVAAQSTDAVDVYHRAFKEKAWVKGKAVTGTRLLDLVADEG